MQMATTVDPVRSGARGRESSLGKDFPLRAYFGHHKCATGWTDAILMEICYHMGIRFRIVHSPNDFRSYSSFPSFVEEEKVDFLAYTNADRRLASSLPLYRGFHMVRDPRDVLVSAYFSHRFSHPTDRWPALERHRTRLQEVSKEEGLLLEMEFSRWVFEQMYSWDYNRENVLELRMEDVTARPVEHLTKIARFLNILDENTSGGARQMTRQFQMRVNRLNQRGRRFMPANLPMFPVPRRRFEDITLPMLETIVRKKSFEKLAGGRKKGEENVQSHYRKGKAGDWQNHFTEAHKEGFKERFNDVLLKLGYETDRSW